MPGKHQPAVLAARAVRHHGPATGVYAVHRGFAEPKEIVPLPNAGHDWSTAFDRHAWKGIETRLCHAD